MRNVILVFLCFCFTTISAQELNCEVKINSDRVTATNQQIFNVGNFVR